MSRASRAVVVLLFLAALGFALRQIRLGLGPGFDEGFYLAAPLRIALGDLPYRDEFFNPLRMFDILLAPLFRLAPELTLYQLRLGWALFELAATVVLFVLFARFAPPALVALACAACIWIPNLIWSPGYHTMSATFFVLGSSLWLLGCLTLHRRRAIGLAAVGGVAHFVGAVAYVPLLVTLVVPAVVLVWDLGHGARHGMRWIATVVHLGVIAGLGGAAIAAVVLSGLGPDWLDATATISSVGYYEVAPAQKVTDFLAQVSPYVPIGIAGALLAAALALGARRRLFDGVGRVATIAAFLALLAALHGLFFGIALPPMATWIGDSLTRPFRVVVFVVGLVAGFAVTGAVRRSAQAGPGWRLVVLGTLGGALAFALLHGFLSGQAFKAMFAAPPLVVCAVVLLYRTLDGGDARAGRRGFAACLATALCLSIASVAYHTRAEERPDGDLVAFSHPRLAHVLAPPTVVTRLGALLDRLSRCVRPGQFLLAYENLPWLYFLTRTRPAIDHAWTSNVIPPELRARSIERMLEARRVPGVAVRAPGLRRDRGPNPIDRFVHGRYQLEAKLPGYEIWTLHERVCARAGSATGRSEGFGPARSAAAHPPGRAACASAPVELTRSTVP